MLEIIELALTLGNWGSAPLNREKKIMIARTFAEWSNELPAVFRLEVYGEWDEDRDVMSELLALEKVQGTVKPLLRLKPRSDRFEQAAKDGIKEIVFEVPASEIQAAVRFMPEGIARVPGFAADMARSAALNGLRPEIALTDITRAKENQVAAISEKVTSSLLAYGVTPRWRLVDSLGLGNPFSGGKLPTSLPAWIRWFNKHLGVETHDISIQASNLLGLGPANCLAGLRVDTSGRKESAVPVTSLFGQGHACGWPQTEVVMAHLLPETVHKISFVELRELFDSYQAGIGPSLPVSGQSAWQIPGEAAPERIEEKVPAFLPLESGEHTNPEIELLLTPLSGIAGLLNLIHRKNPELCIETDDPRIQNIQDEFDQQFYNGRQCPICWREVEPLAREIGII